MASGGEIFILDMGNPIKILELAHKMVQLSGLTVRSSTNPEGDIEISEIGLGPGEKLHEDLMINKATKPTEHEKIMLTNEPRLPWNQMIQHLKELEQAILANDLASSINILSMCVDGFENDHHIIDLKHSLSRH
jgi:FlaA1/EpsC-like NDP-sugar epimerase